MSLKPDERVLDVGCGIGAALPSAASDALEHAAQNQGYPALHTC